MISKTLLKATGIIASVMCLSAAVASAQEVTPQPQAAPAAAAPQTESFTIQLEEKVLPVGDFSAINVSGDFEITLHQGECNVLLTVDNALSPYVQVYVRAKTLYISYDDKAVPKDVKKLYKGRGAPEPTFRAIVRVPELNNINITDNVTVSSVGEFQGDFFQLNAAEKAQLKNLSIKSTTASVSLTKNAQAAISVVADDKVDINNDGNSSIKISATTANVNVTANGNASLSVGAEAANVSVNANGNSKVAVATRAQKVSVAGIANAKVVLSGEAQELNVKADKNLDLDADALKVKTVLANMTGNSKAVVNASETIDASLLGGSSLFYNGAPTFKIGKIVKSTLAPKGASLK